MNDRIFFTGCKRQAKPFGELTFLDDNGFGTSFLVYKKLNWFQKKMWKVFFGLEYKKL